MDNQGYHRILIQRYLDGTATDEELEVLLHLIDEGRINSNFDEETRELYRRTVEENTIPRRRHSRRLLPYVAAAAIAIATIAGWYVFEDHWTMTGGEGLEIAPGRNRATLTLSDGRKIDLSPAHSGIIVGDEVIYPDGTGVIDDDQTGPQLKGGIHTIVTPRGGTYHLTLPDGTRVWLNASTSLNYPSQFDDSERVVELIGEAYFEVNHLIHPSLAKRIPFKVVTPGQTVEVLGTEFNISAYPDEDETATTLVEGKVSLSSSGNTPKGSENSPHSYVVLQPGEQGVLTNGSITKTPVHVERYIAWKSGLFDFTGMTLPEVMRQLERWYDIEVVWQSETPPTRYLGQIYRHNNLTQILKILESAQVRFTIQKDRKLIIH